MLIILEGVDGVGKSTLANKLAERLNGDTTVLHKGPPETDNMLHEYLKPLDDYVPGGRTHIICDRWHIGEEVYGPLFRNESKFDHTTWWYVNAALRARGAFVIYCDRPNIMETLKERGDQMITNESQVGVIRREYPREIGRTHLVKSIVNPFWVEDNYDLDMLLCLADNADRDAARLRDWPTYVGKPSRPEWLLLGDERNQTGFTAWRDAFVPENSTSGRWLIEAVKPNHNVAIANACDKSQTRPLWELIWAVRPRHVVALGKNAAAMCKEADIEFGAVPHPQYMRRFHNKAGDAYADAIVLAGQTNDRGMISWRP